MSQNIEPREVLSYLNELGYTNINAQQLKEFIIDLKKLMKYDERKYSRYNVTSEDTSDLPKKGNNCYICDSNEANIFNTLYNQSTVASKAREVPKKEKQICVQITKAQKQHCKCEAHCIHLDTPPKTQATVSSAVKTTEESPIKSTRPDSQASSSRQETDRTKKSKVSFSRPSTAKVNKSDPVALYHHYQAEWKKQKIPGQDNRSDLRWAIREKMMSGPKVEPVRIVGSRKCNSVR